MNISINKDIADEIIKNEYSKEKTLSPHACRSIKGSRINPSRESIPDRKNIRPIFSHDIDRIIHSSSYSRYIDKTQVFYLIENDHITHRVLHVQLVSKIARTIGRFLNLNEDLIEAISLGHDVGHTPFGHNGETIISDFCTKNKSGCFLHSTQSFRLFHEIENKGLGLNLCIQVLDGIICHNGEVLSLEYTNNPQKTTEEILLEYEKSLYNRNVAKRMIPLTLEGCVMRISDVIAYIGRDIEDAIKVNLIKREDIPKEITDTIGNTNKEIVNNLIIDIINNSFSKGSLVFSQNVFDAFQELKSWNYKHIYHNPKKTTQDGKITRMFNETLEACLSALENNQTDKLIWIWAHKTMKQEYAANTSNARIVADFVSGMTDDFIMDFYANLIIPTSFGYSFQKSIRHNA